MNLFFDSIIIFYLIASAALAIGVFRDRKVPGKWESRHQPMTICFLVFLFLCFSAVVWGSFIEPRLITVNRVAVDLPNFEPPQPVRVAFISDVHTGTYKKNGWVSKISSRVAELNPVLVLIAGDFIVDKLEHAQHLSDFRFLSSVLPVYAVLGDHDYRVKIKNGQIVRVDEKTADVVTDTLEKAGVNVLRNETAQFGGLELVGVDDWLAGKAQFPSLSDGASLRDKVLPTVVLIHNPDFILSEDAKKADLILAGHTHGGQIRLPIIGPVPALPTKLPRSFDQGLFDITSPTPPDHNHPLVPSLERRGKPSGRGGNESISPPLGGGERGGVVKHQLFITSGTGESGPRARLFNPPEIVLLDIY